MEFVSLCFEVDVAEGFESCDGQFREGDEHAAVTGEAFEVGVSLTVRQIPGEQIAHRLA